MKHKPYPAYKPSGVALFEDIPTHWEILPLKRLGDFQAGAGFPDDEQCVQDEELPFYKVSDTNIPGNEIEMTGHNNTISTETAKRLRAFIFHPKTVIFAKVGAALLLNKRRILTRPSCIDNNMMGFIVKRCDPKWSYHWLCGLDFGQLANPGAVPSINEGQLREIPAPVPPLSEQRAIAAFLDRETARIDGLIEKKQRQIELLQEKRAALISHAVTKGLNPKAKLKDSGIEWLGQVPEHWEVKKLGLISTSLQTGPFGSQLHSSDYVDNGIPIINPANIQNGEIVPDNQCTVDEATFQRLSRHRLFEGDIVFARRGEMGRCALVTAESDGFLCGTGSLRVELNKRLVDPHFISLFLSTAGVKDHLLLESVGSTMDNLNTGILARIPIATPPLVEQVVIRQYVAGSLQQIGSTAGKISDSIAMLREYRIALISAAVTGKMDVREEE